MHIIKLNNIRHASRHCMLGKGMDWAVSQSGTLGRGAGADKWVEGLTVWVVVLYGCMLWLDHMFGYVCVQMSSDDTAQHSKLNLHIIKKIHQLAGSYH